MKELRCCQTNNKNFICNRRLGDDMFDNVTITNSSEFLDNQGELVKIVCKCPSCKKYIILTSEE